MVGIFYLQHMQLPRKYMYVCIFPSLFSVSLLASHGVSVCVCVCVRLGRAEVTPGLGNWLFSHLVAKSLPDAAVAAIVQVHLPLHEMLCVCMYVCMYVCVHVCMQLAFHPSPTWLRRLASQQSRDEYLREQTRHVALVRSHPHIYNMHTNMCCWNAAEMESMLGCSC